jgi:hypothetical protein
MKSRFESKKYSKQIDKPKQISKQQVLIDNLEKQLEIGGIREKELK